MICPDWQYPHCGTSSSIHAFCSGCERLLDSPSMVVTCFPSARDTGATHERIAFPSKCTVQAPQSAIPQPNFVPVSPSESRSTHNSGVDGSTSTWTGFPFTKKFVIVISPVRMATLVSLLDGGTQSKVTAGGPFLFSTSFSCQKEVVLLLCTASTPAH